MTKESLQRPQLLKVLVLLWFSIGVVCPVISFASEIEGCERKLSKKEVKKAVAGIDKFYRSLTGFTANFTQESSLLASTEVVSSGGSLRYLRPGRMDWQYKTPSEQRFISDGKSVWFYQPDEDGGGEVYISKLDKAFTSDTPASFLLGLGSLEKDFNVKSGCEVKGQTVLLLGAKSKSEDLEQFFLYADSASQSVVGAKIIDFAENETLIKFSKMDLSPRLTEKSFEFKIPSGVYVDDRR